VIFGLIFHHLRTKKLYVYLVPFDQKQLSQHQMALATRADNHHKILQFTLCANGHATALSVIFPFASSWMQV